jgi:hypothetical protein
MKGQNKLTRREMLKLSSELAAASVLAASVPVTLQQTPVAQAQGPVTLNLFDPTGAYEVTQLFSKRLDTLEGKTICELSNDGWEYDRTFPAIRALLQRQFPTAKFIPYTEFGRIPNADDVKGMQEQVNKMKAAGCQGVIVGNAG